MPNPIQVLLVDDSAIVRGMLRQILKKENDIEVIGTAANGKIGFQEYQKRNPDIVIMDIEMPEMNGIEALELILNHDPNAKVIMCSSLTQSGASLTVKALGIGAVDCLAKPDASSIDRSKKFEEKLLRQIRAFKAQKNIIRPASVTTSQGESKPSIYKDAPIQKKDYPATLFLSKPRIIAIGSSTGGPKALTEVLSGIKKNPDLPPILITQHMPAGFTKMLAQTIKKECGLECFEAEDDMLVKSQTVYVAPGGKHMTVVKRTSGFFIELNEDPPVNFCRPAVDVMFDSVLEAYGSNILALILTGMGNDGEAASKRLIDHSSNNLLIAQDEVTSVVWGMPGAVAHAGVCHSVLPLGLIANAVNSILIGQKP